MRRCGREHRPVVLQHTDRDLAPLDIFGRLGFEIKKFAFLAAGSFTVREWRCWSGDDRLGCEDFLRK